MIKIANRQIFIVPTADLAEVLGIHRSAFLLEKRIYFNHKLN